MPSRARTAWRLSADGQYVRQIGWTVSRTGKRTQVKFRLGANRKEAMRRDEVIRRLWDQLEGQGGAAAWSDVALAAAKEAAATGRALLRTAISGGEAFAEYVARIADLRSTLKDVCVEPADDEAYRRGRLLWSGGVSLSRWTNYVQRGDFKMSERHSKILERPSEVAGPTLHDGLRSYSDWVEQEYVNAAGTVTPWGRTQMRRVVTLLNRHPDRPLADLQFAAIEELIRYWRRRPLSRGTGSSRPVTKVSAENYIKTLKAFFKWLHRSEDYAWRRPDNFEDVKLRVDAVDGDRLPQVAADDLFTLEELALLYRHATPLERTFLALSLNCHFGQAEIASLMAGELFLETAHSIKHQELLGFASTDRDSFVRRYRRKTGVYGEWILFSETEHALHAALERRRSQPDFGPQARVLLNRQGKPYDLATKSGNANQQIANRFASLIARIQEAGHKDFAKRPFKMVRKTAATMIREIADGEIQGLFTCHGQPVKTDDLADVYAVRPFGKLFVALRALRSRLEPVFRADATEST